jgi:TM2 domain-containing membrane protein YozV
MGPSNSYSFGGFQSVSRKSRLVAFLLAFFLGLLGVHRFYVGKIGTGVVQLVLSVSFVGLIVSSVWLVVDCILILTGNFTDDSGHKLTRWGN